MKLPRAVMDDLLAVYLAGEASAETRTLVEEYARGDAEFAAAMKTAAEMTISPQAVKPAADAELRSLQMTRQFVFLRSLFTGMGIFFTLLPFSVVYTKGKLEWLVWDRSEGLAIAFLSIAVASWVAAFMMNREVKKAGL